MSDAGAAASLSAASSSREVIGRSASYPNLQVMCPTGLASSEAMAHHGENQLETENLQRRKGRASRSPRRSADSSVQVREVLVRTTMTTMRQSILRGSALEVQSERNAMSVPASVPASRVSPSKAELEAAMQKLSNDAAMALRIKDEQAKAALVAQRESFEKVAQDWSREAKDVASVEVAQAKIDEKNRASRMLNAEMHEERRVGKLTLRTAEQLVKDEAVAELQMTEKNLQMQAESYVMGQSDRLQALARNEVSEVQEQAYAVYTHKDEKTAEQIIAMNQLQLKLQQMEMAESRQREAAQVQYLRMQKVSEEQQAMWQEQMTTRYDEMLAASERRFEAKISHAASLHHEAVEENKALKAEMVDDHFLLRAARDESSIPSPASREGCGAEDEAIKKEHERLKKVREAQALQEEAVERQTVKSKEEDEVEQMEKKLADLKAAAKRKVEAESYDIATPSGWCADDDQEEDVPPPPQPFNPFSPVPEKMPRGTQEAHTHESHADKDPNAVLNEKIDSLARTTRRC